ncbi:MAG: hypothetical protein E6Q67_13015 [Roseateles sp.]|nr:MAG: hypothetical protein E6Q67_13015 [Roseateles sp.]
MSADQAKAKEMTAADAVKRVKRVTVIKDKDAEKTVTSPIKESEVLDFKDYGSHVVVVTKDGQKFSSGDQAAD